MSADFEPATDAKELQRARVNFYRLLASTEQHLHSLPVLKLASFLATLRVSFADLQNHFSDEDNLRVSQSLATIAATLAPATVTEPLFKIKSTEPPAAQPLVGSLALKHEAEQRATLLSLKDAEKISHASFRISVRIRTQQNAFFMLEFVCYFFAGCVFFFTPVNIVSQGPAAAAPINRHTTRLTSANATVLPLPTATMAASATAATNTSRIQGTKSGQLETELKKEQDVLTESLANMAASLKQNVELLHSALQSDSRVLEGTTAAVEKNVGKLKIDNNKLNDVNAQSWGTLWWQLGALLIAVAVFLFTVFFMRLIPKPRA
jgi:hypothetical protein